MIALLSGAAGAVAAGVVFLVLFFAVTHPASAATLSQADKDLIMKTAEAAAAVAGAATALTESAQAITAAAAALVGVTDTSALDQPVADLNTAVAAVGEAAKAISSLVPQ